MTEVLLIGAGGHAKVVLNEIMRSNKLKIFGIVDEARLGQQLLGFPVTYTDADLESLFQKGIKNAVLGVGSVGSPLVREKIVDRLRAIGFSFPKVVSESAQLGQEVLLGEGVFVGAGVVVNPGSTIGSFAIVNSGAIVEHDCELGEFTHISPGTVLCGGVQVGARTHVGALSVVIQGVKVGSDSLIGAGSVVTKNFGPGLKGFGNPCGEVGKNG